MGRISHKLHLKEEGMKKKSGFFQCDKCIGITPCTILKNGKIICDYCKDEVRINTFIGPISNSETPYEEHRV